jgi:hypothetical protein
MRSGPLEALPSLGVPDTLCQGHSTENWPEMSAAAPAWFAKATIVTLHNGTVVQAL